MNKDVEKIRAEIERLRQKVINGATSGQYSSETIREKNQLLVSIISFIDSLQEEPVSIWHDASEKPNIKEKGGIFVITSSNGEYIGSRYYSHNDVTITFGNYDKWAYLNDLLNLSNVQRTTKNWKEPVSEDLEEAAKHYLYSNILYDDVYVGNPTDKDCIEMFKAGAEWQKEQDQSTIELAEDHAMLAGMEKMKEQMMKDAADVTVHIDAGNYPYIPQIALYDYDKDIPLAREGDKYKVILIKQE